ncbi:MAG: FkbM family methyltransferase [Candidatus Peribacteraceae bacterium]|nr:FkbM family methyltransferase [Candidatus Peribacteraceae bacterium]
MAPYKRITMGKFASFLRDETAIDLQSIRTIYDVGAMDGKDAMALKRLFPHAEVYAIEGLKENFDTYLAKRRNIHGFHAVIADHDGQTSFYKKNMQGLHGIYERRELPTEEERSVPCVRLDTFVRSNRLPAPDLMKIDVEGATFDVLSSCGSLLDAVKVLQIETETIEYFRGQKLQKEVYCLLREHGFDLILEIVCCDGQNDSIWVHRSVKRRPISPLPEERVGSPVVRDGRDG